MLKKCFLYLILIDICVMGIYSIDLAGGRLPFSLTLPFIFSLLTIFVGIVYFIFNKIKLTNKMQKLLFITGLFILFLVISIYTSVDIMLSIQRIFLLITYLMEGVVIFLFFTQERLEEYKNKLLFCLAFNIIFGLFYSILAYLIYIKVLPDINSSFISVSTQYTISYYAIRFPGAVGDPNTFAYLITVSLFLYVMIKKELTKRDIILIVIYLFCLLMTFSRTGWVFGAVMFMPYLYKIFIKDITLKRIIVYSFIIICLITFVISRENIRAAIFQRFSFDVSASTHFYLYEKAYELMNPKILFLGNGYGSSSLLLVDIFSEDGNFHSMYLTFLMESGIFSLISFIILITYILSVDLNSKNVWLLLANLAYFAFYQVHVYSFFWLFIFMLYIISFDKQNDYILEEEEVSNERNNLSWR